MHVYGRVRTRGAHGIRYFRSYAPLDPKNGVQRTDLHDPTRDTLDRPRCSSRNSEHNR
jgi:hypothetical protein